MKHLLLIGGSGCGKTTLAMHLEEYYPEKYKRVRQMATREPRPGEIDGYDYIFVSESDFYKTKMTHKMIEVVENQFAPNVYGATADQLEKDKWNITIVSLEAFFSFLNNVNENDTIVLLNILVDGCLDIPEREGRDSKFEERTNVGVLRNYYVKNSKKFLYHEIRLSELKRVRNSQEKLDEYIDAFLPDVSPAQKIKNATTAEEIADVIADLDCKFGPDLEQLIFYRCLALGIESSTVYVHAINKINNKMKN